jgi:hypothetical protein
MGIIDKRPTPLSARVSRLLRSVLLASHELGHALAVRFEALQELADLLEFRHAGLGHVLNLNSSLRRHGLLFEHACTERNYGMANILSGRGVAEREAAKK